MVKFTRVCAVRAVRFPFKIIKKVLPLENFISAQLSGLNQKHNFIHINACCEARWCKGRHGSCLTGLIDQKYPIVLWFYIWANFSWFKLTRLCFNLILQRMVKNDRFINIWSTFESKLGIDQFFRRCIFLELKHNMNRFYVHVILFQNDYKFSETQKWPLIFFGVNLLFSWHWVVTLVFF